MLISDPYVLNVVFIGSIIFGLAVCFFGYRLFRFILSVSGFIVGSSFLAGVAYTLTEGKEVSLMIIAGLAGGIIFAILLLYLYNVGIFLLGALFGLVVSMLVLTLFNIDNGYLILILSAIIIGVLTVTIQKFMLILITSFLGAWIAVLGSLYIINNRINPFSEEFLNNISDIESYRIILSLVALWFLGFVAQYIIFPKRNTKITSENQKTTTE